MPPAIEEEEELEYASSSGHTASPQQLAGDDAVLINTFDKFEQPPQQPDREQSPVPVVSDIPLVVSDLPQVVAGISNGVTAPPPQPQHNPQRSEVMEKGTRKSRKRKASPKGPMAKRRRGQKRDFPCTYCVRRMANDPSWACHEAAVNQFGEPYYTGSRCSECVGAHVSCLSVPPHGIEPVTNLMKAAQEAVRSKNDGTQNISLLAAYQAAIGPALRAIVGVTVPPSEKGRRGPKKTKPDKKSSQNAVGHKPPPLSSSSSSRKTKETPNNGPRSRHGNEQQHSTTQHRGAHHHHQQQPPADPNPDPDPASFYSQPQPPPPEDPGTFEKMERQALRRRKVEALESLAHTAALFLAEFMDFKKTSSSTANGTGAGGAYAAAAAGMAANLFQPPTGEEGDGWVGHQHDGAGEGRSGRLSDSEKSANDSDDDDDQDIPARFPQGNADGEEYDSEETPYEPLEDFSMRPGAGQEEPDVKVEDD